MFIEINICVHYVFEHTRHYRCIFCKFAGILNNVILESVVLAASFGFYLLFLGFLGPSLGMGEIPITRHQNA
jgi:hypothetical protein